MPKLFEKVYRYAFRIHFAELFDSYPGQIVFDKIEEDRILKGRFLNIYREDKFRKQY